MLYHILATLVFFSNNARCYTSSSFVGSQASLITWRRRSGRSSLRMEDFGLLRNSGIGFDDLWQGNPVISERALEKEMNKQGLRFKMNRTEKECQEVGSLGKDIQIGPIIFFSPRVSSIWEAFGFTATSNNEARQKCKIEAQENSKRDPNGVRLKYLRKYGYPRLVGTNGIFYADQLSSDSVPMGGFGMNKNGVIWPVPDVIRMKKK